MEESEVYKHTEACNIRNTCLCLQLPKCTASFAAQSNSVVVAVTYAGLTLEFKIPHLQYI